MAVGGEIRNRASQVCGVTTAAVRLHIFRFPRGRLAAIAPMRRPKNIIRIAQECSNDDCKRDVITTLFVRKLPLSDSLNDLLEGQQVKAYMYLSLEYA